MNIGLKVLGLLATLGLSVACGQAAAQNYPSKPIHLVVGYPPGGGTDNIARIIGQKLGERLGQAVIVDNKPGANAIIGVEYVAKAAPDGYTLLVGADGEMVFNQGLYDRLPYDTLKDFIPVISLSSNPLVFAVHPSVPVTSIKELIALAKAKPGQLFYSSGAPPFQVAMELFKKQTGADIQFIPYKGGGPSVTAAVAGEVSMVVVAIGPVLGQLRAGKLRALAVTSPKRYSIMPEIPTMAEAGIPNFEVAPITGLFAPVGTPKPIVDKLYSELAAILKMEDVRARFASLGVDAGGLSATEFAPVLKANIDKWTKATRDAHIKAE